MFTGAVNGFLVPRNLYFKQAFFMLQLFGQTVTKIV